jgi:hypothetical protein
MSRRKSRLQDRASAFAKPRPCHFLAAPGGGRVKRLSPPRPQGCEGAGGERPEAKSRKSGVVLILLDVLAFFLDAPRKRPRIAPVAFGRTQPARRALNRSRANLDENSGGKTAPLGACHERRFDLGSGHDLAINVR